MSAAADMDGAREGDFKGTDAAPPVRQSARRGVFRRAANAPRVPGGDIWLDRDVAEYLHVCLRTVKRIANDGPRPGELDLRRARPVFVGDRRWFAENVKALVREGVAAGLPPGVVAKNEDEL